MLVQMELLPMGILLFIIGRKDVTPCPHLETCVWKHYIVSKTYQQLETNKKYLSCLWKQDASSILVTRTIVVG